MAASSSAGLERAQPRHHHDHHEGQAERHVRQDHGVQPELPVQPAEHPLEQRQQRNAHHDLRRHQRKIQRAREQPASRASTARRRRACRRRSRSRVAASAMITLFQVASISCGSRKIGRVPAQREALPHREARRVEAEHGQHQQRQVQEGEHAPPAYTASQRFIPGAPCRAAGTPPPARITSAISSMRDRRAERPVARGGELVLHQVADQHRAAAAQQVRRQIRAQARDEDQDGAGANAGRGERHEHADERGATAARPGPPRLRAAPGRAAPAWRKAAAP